MSLLYLWYGAQGGHMETDEALNLLTQGELLGALNAVLTLRKLVEQTAEHAVTKEFVLEVLEYMVGNVLEALKDVASGTWPYASAYDVFLAKKAEEKEAEAAPTPPETKAEAG